MPEDDANIRQLFQAQSGNSRLRKKIKAVLIVMMMVTIATAMVATAMDGVAALFAAFCGGLSQMLAVAVYGWVVRADQVLPPKALLARHFMAQAAKVLVALILLVAGVYGIEKATGWFVMAFSINFLAYWLVLIIA